jgi:hypothetical protein
MFECGLHAAMLATTHRSHVHDWQILVIEKHLTVCWENFCGDPLETITTDGPPKIGPIIGPFYAHFSVEHESSFSFKLGSSKSFPGGF